MTAGNEIELHCPAKQNRLICFYWNATVKYIVLHFQNSIFHSNKNQELGNTRKSNEISSWCWGVDFIFFYSSPYFHTSHKQGQLRECLTELSQCQWTTHCVVFVISAICLKSYFLEWSHYTRLLVLDVCTGKMTTLEDPDLRIQIERIVNLLFYNVSGRSLNNLSFLSGWDCLFYSLPWLSIYHSISNSLT